MHCVHISLGMNTVVRIHKWADAYMCVHDFSYVCMQCMHVVVYKTLQTPIIAWVRV